MTDYVMRPMSVNDIRAIAKIDRQVFSMPWPSFIFMHEINHNRAAYMGLIEGKRPAQDQKPTSWLQRVTQLERPVITYGGVWMDGKEGHISTLATVPDYQRQGFGELMLVGLLWRAIKMKMERAALEVRVSNTGAQALYRKYQFEIMATHYEYYRDNDEDAYIMRVPRLDQPYQEFLRARWSALCDKFDFKDRYTGYQPRND